VCKGRGEWEGMVREVVASWRDRIDSVRGRNWGDGGRGVAVLVFWGEGWGSEGESTAMTSP